MIKMIIVITLFPLMFISSQQDTVVNYNYEKDTPEWLKAKIDSMVTSHPKYYWGTKFFRYEWNDTLLFEFDIPISSCKFCEVYYYDGTKNIFTDSKAGQDYTFNRKNKLLIWKWPDR